jgi:hypothetical protein
LSIASIRDRGTGDDLNSEISIVPSCFRTTPTQSLKNSILGNLIDLARRGVSLYQFTFIIVNQRIITLTKVLTEVQESNPRSPSEGDRSPRS